MDASSIYTKFILTVIAAGVLLLAFQQYRASGSTAAGAWKCIPMAKKSIGTAKGRSIMTTEVPSDWAATLNKANARTVVHMTEHFMNPRRALSLDDRKVVCYR